MEKELTLQKIEQAQKILKEKNIDLWMTFVRESSYIHDPALDIILGTNVTWQSAFMIPATGETTAIIGSLEIPLITGTGLYKNVTGYLKSIKEPLLEYLYQLNPQCIAINVSKNSVLADGMPHGLYLNLLDHLDRTPYKELLISSEEIILALRSRKSEKELEIMKNAVKETLLIFDEVTSFIKPGKTEIEVAEFIRSKVSQRGFSYAWDEESCPAVFTGPNSAGAHAGPTNRVIEKGHLVNIDFGIKLNGYCSDLQRTWYILKDDENDAPHNVKKGFSVLHQSIREAASIMKPGITGVDVDSAARNFITSNGYEEYKHGLGHQIGRVAHDAGPGLFPNWERYGTLPYIPLEAGQVFTIEPRLYVENHGIVTIEEEVVLRENGVEYLSNPQMELYLIRE